MPEENNTEANKPYKNLEVDEKESGVVEIRGEVKEDVFETYKKRVLNEIQEDFETEGFRKGKVPTDIIEDKVGEEHILNQAAREALNGVYPQIIEDTDLEIMSRPRVNITKLADGNPLGFKIQVGVRPDIELPDYKQIAQDVREEAEEEEEDVEISDEELEQVIKHVQAQQAREAGEEGEEVGEVPELTDEFVQELGDFESVEEFREKMRENLKQEKQMMSQRKVREKIAQRLAEEADFEIPDVTIESELQSKLERFMESLEDRDTTLEEYLENIDKSEEEFIQDEKESLTTQIKTRLILEAIAEEEDVEPDEEQVKQRLKAMQQYQPDADPRVLREHIERSLKNQKVIELLEAPDSEE